MGIDYYAVLGLKRNATAIEIKLAYRKWALVTHPHKNTDACPPNSVAIDSKKDINEPLLSNKRLPLPALAHNQYWPLLNEAYDILSNPLRREMFDRFGEEGLKTGVPLAMTGCYTPSYVYHQDCRKTYEEVFGNFSPYSDLIDACTDPNLHFNNNTTFDESTRMMPTQKDADIEKEIYVDLLEVFYGGMRKMKVLRREFVDETQTVTVVREHILTVPIARGIRTGTRLRYAEQGDRTHLRIPADIVFVICDKPNATFERIATDLHTTMQVSLKQALIGMNISIHTIDDRRIVISITDVIRPNYVKQIENEGLPFPDGILAAETKGNLIVHFDIIFPELIDREHKTHLADLFDRIYSR